MADKKRYITGTIAKVIETDDGGREVWGFATLEVVDKTGEIADFDGTVKAFEKWSSDISKRTGGKNLGNVRVMHQAIQAGKTIHWEPTETTITDDGGNEQAVKGIWVGAYVPPTKPDIIRDIDEGILNAFSIGGDYEKRWYDNATKAFRFIPVLAEYSLVDNPACPGADIVDVVSKAMQPWSGHSISKAAQVSYEDLSDKIQNACSQAFTAPFQNYWDGYVIATFPDHVIVRDWTQDTFWDIPYTQDDDGNITLGAPTEVDRVESFVPVEAMKMYEVAKEEHEMHKADDKQPPHIGLSDEIKSKFLAQAKKDPTEHISAAMRRLSEWAASGSYPTGLNYTDIKWMYDQYADILHDRNPDSQAGGNFPAEKAFISQANTGLEKCKSLTDTLAAVKEEAEAKAPEDKGKETSKSVGSENAQAQSVTKTVPPTDKAVDEKITDLESVIKDALKALEDLKSAQAADDKAASARYSNDTKKAVSDGKGEGEEKKCPKCGGPLDKDGKCAKCDKEDGTAKGQGTEGVSKIGAAVSKARAAHLEHAKNHINAALNGTDYTAADHDVFEQQMSEQVPNGVEQEADLDGPDKSLFDALFKYIAALQPQEAPKVSMDGVAKSEDVSKAVEAVNGVTKSLEAITTQLGEMEKRLKTIEEQPVQGGPVSNPSELQRVLKTVPVDNKEAIKAEVLQSLVKDTSVSLSARQEIAKNLALQAHPLARHIQS